MFEALVITFREGLESFLIVAIMLAYLRKTERQNLVAPVYAGAGVALLISATTGWHIKDLAQEPMMEGLLALIAGVLVASLTVMMLRSAKNIGKSITAGLENHALKGGFAAAAGIFAFTVLMVAREGMELALMLGAMTSYIAPATMMSGVALGAAAVGLIGWLWISQSARINLKLFMQVTGIFLVMFAVHLFIYGIHELSEGAALPFIGADMNFTIHTATEMFDQGSLLASMITYSLIAVPCGWLALSFIREKLAPRPQIVAAK